MAILMTLVIVMTIPAASLAAEMTNSPDVELKVNQQYAFTYTEYTDAEHRTIRSYRKQNDFFPAYSYSAVKASTERTKAVLMSLGMTSAFIDELSTEDLPALCIGLLSVSTEIHFIGGSKNGTKQNSPDMVSKPCKHTSIHTVSESLAYYCNCLFDHLFNPGLSYRYSAKMGPFLRLLISAHHLLISRNNVL